MGDMTARTPAILVWGAQQVRDYGVDEFDHALATGFGPEPGAQFTLDAKPYGQRFLAACAAWALMAGLLCVETVGTDRNGEVCTLRLTEAGKARYCAGWEEAAQ